MMKLSVKMSRKSNQFRRKSKLRRRRNTRKIYTRKTNIIEGGGGGHSVLRRPAKKQWNPNKFFATKHWKKDRCSGITFHEAWKFEIYRLLGVFFDNRDIVVRDACSHHYPIVVENINQENKAKYLRFYATKMDWLVKQLCIASGGGDYSTPPPSNMTLTPDMSMFFLWLTNNTPGGPDSLFLGKSAPNPDDYDEETGASDEETRRLLSECNV
jgi:hypothetical protein